MASRATPTAGTFSAPRAVTTCRVRASASGRRVRDTRQQGNGCHGHARQDGDAHALRDEVLDGDVVVGLERDVGDEPGARARLEQMPPALRASGDPALSRQPGQIDGSLGGRVVDRQHEDRVVGSDGAYRQSGCREIELAAIARVAVGQRDVGTVLAHRHDRLGRLGFDEADRNPGAARGHGRDDTRDDGRRRRGERGDPHAPGAQAAEFGQVARGRIERRGDGRRVAGEHLARLGEPHAATDALDDG